MIVNFEELQIITVSYNHSEHLNNYFQSFIDVYGKFPCPIFLSDNSSDDCSGEILLKWQQDYPDTIFVHNNTENLGFSKANNILSKKSQSKYILFLNPDITFDHDFITPCLEYLRDKDICLSPTLADPQSKQTYKNYDSFYDSPLYTINKILSKYSLSKYQKVDWIQGACLFLHRKHFEKAGCFNEQYFVFTEDMHLGKSLKDVAIHSYITKTSTVFHPHREISKQQFKCMSENLRKYHNQYPIYPYLLHIYLLNFFKLSQINYSQLRKSLNNEQ